MKTKKKSSDYFDPNGNYTGKYLNENYFNDVIDTEPEQDVDDL